MTPVEGQQIGSFVLRHRISDGGMGSVWAAEHLTLNRDVAIKFLTTDRADEAATKRFALEARTVARISSPHVPQVFDQGLCDDGTPYLAMEIVGGTDLKEWVNERGQMTLPRLARLVEHVCRAMTASHALGIVHRDIKPENIVLRGGEDDFHATLVDFGISKSTTLSASTPRLTLAGSTVGTPSYMSPEQLLSPTSVDERADIWSLGVVAYWALTGRLPFHGDSFAAICFAIQSGHFRLVSEVRPGLPLALDEWFARALSLNVDHRFQSADLMIKMLNVALASPAAAFRAEPIVIVPSYPSGLLVGTSRRGRGMRAPATARGGRSDLRWAITGATLSLLLVAGVGRATAPSRTAANASSTATLESPGSVPAAIGAAEARPIALEPAPDPSVGPAPLASAMRERPAVLPPRAAAASLDALPAQGMTMSAVASIRSGIVTMDAGAPGPGRYDWHPRDDLGEP